MSTDLVVETRGLQKRFGTTAALDGIDLAVRAGEVHGFLGPNGAGKSTTIRVLLGLLRADGGTARVLGRDPWADAVAVHREIAYVPGDVALWPTLSGGEAIDLITRLRGGADPALRERLIRDFDLDPTKKARSYSKGNRQKVALIAALARPARLYILDEPTSGLDPLMEEVFRHEVERVRADGASVLLSSHLLDEVEKLCERVTILRAGRVVESGTLAELRHLTRTSFRVGTRADPAGIARLPGVHDLESEPGQLAFDVDTEAVQQVLQTLVVAGVRTLTVTPPSLESLFLRHYGSDPEDSSARAAGSASRSGSAP